MSLSGTDTLLRYGCSRCDMYILELRKDISSPCGHCVRYCTYLLRGIDRSDAKGESVYNADVPQRDEYNNN